MARTSYDLITYESRPYKRTHPDNLCSIGRLFGMTPAPPYRCRVLELGAAAAGNIIPMAEQLQESVFIGIDLSKTQVLEGQEMLEALGLNNLSIFNKNILEIDLELDRFDYIICHGVFSWVAPEVQDKILTLCRSLLTPHGIAYISFNTYPGWHIREGVRRMMQYHSARFTDVDARIRESRALMAFVSEEVEKTNTPYASLLKTELGLLNGIEDFYLFHEHLEDINTPCYFYEFVSRLKKHGLQYLGDADVTTMLGSGLPATSLETIHQITDDIVQAEQYMDFIRNRGFRMALVCQEDVPLERTLNYDSLVGLKLAARPDAEQAAVDTTSESELVFRIHAGKTIRTASPILKTALKQILESWPKSIDVADLYGKLERELNAVGRILDEQAKRRLAVDLLTMIMDGGMTIHSWDPPLPATCPPKPRLRPSSVLTAIRYGFVTNARHERIVLDGPMVHLSQYLDGQNDRNAMIDKLVESVKKGVFNVIVDGEAVTSGDDIKAHVERIVDTTLKTFHDSLLFVKP